MDTSNIITSNIVSGRTRKGKGTVYDQARNPLISHRDITQLDEDEITVHTDDRQNRNSGTNATDNMSIGNNDEDDEDDEEEDVVLDEEEEEEDEEDEEEEHQQLSNNQYSSSRFSRFLSFGCLSPRKMLEEVRLSHKEKMTMMTVTESQVDADDNDKIDNNKVDNDVNLVNIGNIDHFSNDNHPQYDWILKQLSMRDFFLYSCLSSGTKFFRLQGIPIVVNNRKKKKKEKIKWKTFQKNSYSDDIDDNEDNGSDNNSNKRYDDHNRNKKKKNKNVNNNDNEIIFQKWATGQTNIPLIDASMNQLSCAGFNPHRTRQNVVSFLTKDLCLDWRSGAEFYQFMLEDYCVGCNWGNWLYFAGVGSDPKFRHFRTVSQALRYDRNGGYVKRWCPGIGVCKVDCNSNRYGDDHGYAREMYLRPWDFDKKWKEPIVAVESQYTYYDLQRLRLSDRLTDDDVSQ